MKPSNTITVFGNPIEPQDSLAVALVPELQAHFPHLKFIIADPTESLEPLGNPWYILDVAQGIDTITVITDLKDLDRVPGSGVHDYDVYLDLRLKEKLGELPPIKLILLPSSWTLHQALENIAPVITTLTD